MNVIYSDNNEREDEDEDRDGRQDTNGDISRNIASFQIQKQMYKVCDM